MMTSFKELTEENNETCQSYESRGSKQNRRLRENDAKCHSAYGEIRQKKKV
jgi:hypothetical protein